VAENKGINNCEETQEETDLRIAFRHIIWT